MIDIHEQFTVPASPDDVYRILSDPRSVAECVRGGALGETHEDGSIESTLTVRFGAMRVAFRGRVQIILDERSRAGSLVATGRDGQGGTKFRATTEFSVRRNGDGSEVLTSGAVELSGKLASVIEGAASAVVRRMTVEFIDALSLRLVSESATLPAAGAEPDSVRGDGVSSAAALLLHGLGASPRTLRPWGEHLSGKGVTVAIPRLPGHGTRWQDLGWTTEDDWLVGASAALTELTDDGRPVVVMGVSLGATLALRLAELRPECVVGVVALNPVVGPLPGMQWVRLFRRSKRVDLCDVKRARLADAATYGRLHLRAATSIRRLGESVLRDAATITQPVLIGRSAVNHVVDRTDAIRLAASLTGTCPAVVDFPDSYDMVPLDNDARLLFDRSVEFVGTILSTSHVPRGECGAR